MENNSDQSGSLVQPTSTTPAEAPAEAPATPPTPAPAPEAAMPDPAPSMDTKPPEPPKAEKPKGGGGMMKKVLMIVLVVLIPVGAFLGYYMSNQKANKDKAKLNSDILALQATLHDLPVGAAKVSDCIPNMGYHYVTKTSDKEYGPFLLVNKQDKVIGVEYMAAQDMYTAIPGTDPPVQLVEKNSPMYGWKFDHFEISHLPKGHEGLLRDHIDVHLFTVPASVEKNACV